MPFIVKNPSTTIDRVIDDLNCTIVASTEVDLYTLELTLSDIETSADLQALFTAETLQKLNAPGGAPVTPGDEFENPNVVTPADLGNDIAQWNANKIQGVAVSSDSVVAGQIMVSDGTTWGPDDNTPAHNATTGRAADNCHDQYHTDARASTWLGTKNTDSLSEGVTNKYYSEALVSANTTVAANTSERHTQNSDTLLDEGGANEIAVADLKKLYDIFNQYGGSGLLSGGVLTATGGVGFAIASGDGTVSNGDVDHVVWSNLTGNCTNAGSNFINVNASGNIEITSSCPDHNYIPVGFIYTNGSNTAILTMASIPRLIDNFSDLVHEFVKHAIGTIIQSGNVVGEKSSPNELELDVSGGVMFTQLNEITTTTTSTFYKMFDTSDNDWVLDSNAVNHVNTSQWNNINNPQATALVTMTTDYWKKDLVLRMPNGLVYYIFGQAEYATEDDAKAASLPAIPSSISLTGAANLCQIVSQQGDTTIADRIYDLRPLLSRVFGYGTAGAAGSLVDHDDTLHRDLDNNHPQYHTDGRADTWLGSKNTDDLAEGSNLYYTEARVNANTNVAANTTHRGLTTNPHAVTAAQVGKDIAQWNADEIQGVSVAVGAPTTNQYLKYNSVTGKLEYTSGSMDSPDVVFSAYLASDESEVLDDSNWHDVPLSQVDNTGQFSFSSPEVTVNHDGWILVNSRVTVDNTDGNSRSGANVQLLINTGSGWVVSDAGATTYNRTSAAGQNTATFATSINVSTGDKLKLQAKRYAGNDDLDLVGGKCALTIITNRGPKGDTGAAGSPGSGTTLVVKDEDTNIPNTPHTALNFIGDWVEATDGGSGVANITVGPNASDRMQFFDDFIGDWTDWWWTSTGGTGSSVEWIEAIAGQISLQSGGVSGNSVWLGLGNSAVTIVANAELEFRLKLVETTYAYVSAGLNGSNQYAQFYVSENGNWFVSSYNGSGNTLTNTGMAADGDFHVFKIEATSTSIKFYIDGLLKATHTSNLPTSLMTFSFYMDTSNSSSSGEEIRLDYVKISCDRET